MHQLRRWPWVNTTAQVSPIVRNPHGPHGTDRWQQCYSRLVRNLCSSACGSATVTVNAEWSLKPMTRLILLRKWTQRPDRGFVPNVRPSSANEIRGPTAVHQRYGPVDVGVRDVLERCVDPQQAERRDEPAVVGDGDAVPPRQRAAHRATWARSADRSGRGRTRSPRICKHNGHCCVTVRPLIDRVPRGAWRLAAYGL